MSRMSIIMLLVMVGIIMGAGLYIKHYNEVCEVEVGYLFTHYKFVGSPFQEKLACYYIDDMGIRRVKVVDVYG